MVYVTFILHHIICGVICQGNSYSYHKAVKLMFFGPNQKFAAAAQPRPSQFLARPKKIIRPRCTLITKFEREQKVGP